MRIVDLSMTVEECDSAPFAKDEYYFKLKPIVKWEEKGFVSNMVEMTVHAGTHIDTPHHFFRDMPGIEALPLDAMMGEAVVMDLTFKGHARAQRPGRPHRAGRDPVPPHRLAQGPRHHRSKVVGRVALPDEGLGGVVGRQAAARARLRLRAGGEGERLRACR